MEIISIASSALGLVGIVGGAGFYLKFTATKANIEGKDATIATLEKQNAVYKDDNTNLTKENSELKGENRSLREIATQTPEIVQLTKTVSDSVKGQNKVVQGLADLTEQIKQLVQVNRGNNG